MHSGSAIEPPACSQVSLGPGELVSLGLTEGEFRCVLVSSLEQSAQGPGIGANQGARTNVIFVEPALVDF